MVHSIYNPMPFFAHKTKPKIKLHSKANDSFKGYFCVVSLFVCHRHSHHHLISQVSNILIKFETNIETVTMVCDTPPCTERWTKRCINRIEKWICLKRFRKNLWVFVECVVSSLSSSTISIWLSDFWCGASSFGCYAFRFTWWVCSLVHWEVQFSRQNNKRCHLYN